MSKGLTPGVMLPDFTLPDETRTMRRRPSPFQLWEDLQDLLRRTKHDFDPTTTEARAAWRAA